MSIDTSNKSHVEVVVDGISFDGRDTPVWLSRDDALNLAAWIVLRADPDGEHFQTVLGTIMLSQDP